MLHRVLFGKLSSAVLPAGRQAGRDKRAECEPGERHQTITEVREAVK